MKIELLKFLTAQASQYELGEHDWESLKSSDISHILGLMTVSGDGERLHPHSSGEAAVWLGEIMYLDNRNHIRELTDHVGQYIIKRCKIDRNLGRAWNIAYNSINAYVDPKLCEDCHGAGNIQLEGVIGTITCGTCQGGGRAPRLSQNKIADMLGIHRSRFHRTWAEVFEEAEWKLDRLHDNLIAVFVRRLGYRDHQEDDAHQDQYWPYKKTPKNKALDAEPI